MNMKGYKDTITLDDNFSIGQVSSLLERLREHGSAELIDYNKITFTYEESDQWDLRDVLAEVEQYLQSEGIYYTVKKENVYDI
jgi:hypothetical protein